MRYLAFVLSTLLFVLAVLAAILLGGIGWIIVAVLLAGVVALGVYDVTQSRHSILRNYPILGHARFMLEAIRPELQQYFIERNYHGRPFDPDTRTSIYERAEAIQDEQAYGTERDLGEPGYEWLLQSIHSFDPPKDPPRVRLGGPDCSQPYDIALLNVSAMSFGALSGNALTALNRGADKGGFAHDTGEGGLSKYHLNGAEVAWEIGTGYFGARTKDGGFDREQFKDKASHEAIKCVSLKLKLHDVDLAAIASAAGLQAIRVTDPDALSEARRSTFAHPGPALIDVATNPDEISLPPKVKPGQAWGFAIAKLTETLESRSH